MKKVRIVGAGFSGLSLALELVKLGIAVEIVESANGPGGFIQSPKTAHGIYETAANGFLSNQLVEKFVQELGLQPLRPKPDAKKRYLYRGYPQRWPLQLLESLFFIVHFLKALVCRQFKPRKQETVFDWGQRNLGKSATKFILEPALQGIYAGDSKQLSAELIFNKSKSAGRNLGLLSFEGGMGEMIQRMVEVLKSKGAILLFSSVFNPAETEVIPTVLCTSPLDASAILKRWQNLQGSETNIQILEQMEMRPLTTVTAYFAQSPSRYSGFGILFSPSENRWPLGILQNSNIFARKNPAYSETWIIAGVEATDLEIKAKLLSERLAIYNETQQPLEVAITRWSKALPHYTVKHKTLIEALVPMKQVWLHGNYLGGIGLSKILARSQSLAAEINQAL